MSLTTQHSLPPEELGKLFEEFSQVTAGLQHAHDLLLEEVQTLRDELAAKNRRLERKKRLEALGRVAAGVAHEFRNPLGGIRLTVDSLIEANSDSKAQERLEHIRRATTHLDCIVEDLLTFARSNAPARSRVCIGDAVEQALEVAFPHGPDRELIRQGSADQCCYVDRHAFIRVLANLLVNASQALEGREGRMGIGWGETPTGQLWLEVVDDGDGIPSGEEEQIFHPFHSRREGGTGLGLAIVHDRVEAHEGEIAVISEPRGMRGAWRGACFRIVLPLGLPDGMPEVAGEK